MSQLVNLRELDICSHVTNARMCRFAIPGFVTSFWTQLPLFIRPGRGRGGELMEPWWRRRADGGPALRMMSPSG